MDEKYTPREAETDADSLLQLVGFKLGKDEFGVDILAVQEIIRMHEITHVPNAPEFVEGVINLRGKILPVIDLRKRLGYPEHPIDKRTRIIVVTLDSLTIGFIVDAVSEVLRIPASVTEKPPYMVSGIQGDYITSVAKLEDRLLILLDLSRLLSKNEFAQIES